MNTKVQKFNTEHFAKNLPDIHPGSTVKVHQKIKEGDKERIQIFEGVIIAAKHGKGISATITVRKVVEGVGVERVFPIHSPAISKIEVVKSAKVRRAKLYYLREAKGKKAKLKKKDFAIAIAEEKAPETEMAEETTPAVSPETTQPTTPEATPDVKPEATGGTKTK